MSIFPSKYQAETVTVRWNFAANIPIGITISSAVVVCTVFLGIDSTPENLLSGTASATGTVVKQQLTAGNIGVTYNLTCTATLSNGKVLSQTSRQSVIPNLGGMFGDSTPLYLVGDLPDGSLGVAYSEFLDIVGGIPPYSGLHLKSGSMPAWLSHNIVGNKVVYTGVPNALGTSTFNPEIFDFLGNSADDPQVINVADLLTIVGDLPDGVSGDPINFQYAVVGGTPPYVVTITSGLLPSEDNSDIDNTGLVTGDYGTPGLYTWNVHAVDSLGLIGDLPDSCVVGDLLWFLTGDSEGGFGEYLFSDGVTWLNPPDQFVPAFAAFNGVISSDTDFLCAGNATTLFTNNDGTTWTPSVGLSSNNLQQGIYVEGVWMFATNSGYVARSTDGVNFTTFYVGSGLDLRSVASANGITLVVGYDSWVSFNLGISFSLAKFRIIDPVNEILSIATDGDIFIGVGTHNNIRSTANGAEWFVVTSPFSADIPITDIVWSAGLWVIVNTDGEIAYSATGLGSWTISSTVVAETIFTLFGKFGHFAICGDTGAFYTAGIDMVWTKQTTSFDEESIYGVTALLVP